MDIERIIAFVITMVIVTILKSVIKFGIKLLVIIGIACAFVYFVMPEVFPIIPETIDGILGSFNVAQFEELNLWRLCGYENERQKTIWL